MVSIWATRDASVVDGIKHGTQGPMWKSEPHLSTLSAEVEQAFESIKRARDPPEILLEASLEITTASSRQARFSSLHPANCPGLSRLNLSRLSTNNAFLYALRGHSLCDSILFTNYTYDNFPALFQITVSNLMAFAHHRCPCSRRTSNFSLVSSLAANFHLVAPAVADYNAKTCILLLDRYSFIPLYGYTSRRFFHVDSFHRGLNPCGFLYSLQSYLSIDRSVGSLVAREFVSVLRLVLMSFVLAQGEHRSYTGVVLM